MTTKNTIVTHTERDVIFVPIESIHANDSISWVYRQMANRAVRQQVLTDMRNDNQIIITAGLDEGDAVLMNIPPEPEALRFISLD
jgi:HlyD family secretion protein